MENAYELTLTVRMSRCYHSLCERWFLKLNKLVTLCNVFLGSGVVATSLSSAAANLYASFYGMWNWEQMWEHL